MNIDNLNTLPLKGHFYCGAARRIGAAAVTRSIQKFKAIGGGLIRDVLAGRRTLLMTRELYATPILFGCALYVVLLEVSPEYRFAGMAGCCLFIFGLRAAAIYWELRVPEWLTTQTKEEFRLTPRALRAYLNDIATRLDVRGKHLPKQARYKRMMGMLKKSLINPL